MATRSEEQPADREADPVEFAREIALRALAVRARTRSELATLLGRKRVPDDVVTEVLDRLAAVGLIDDRAYADEWVAGQGRRLRSSRVLRQELRARGVDAEVIAEATRTIDPQADTDVARALVAKRLPGLRGADAATRYRRLAGMLARRGFAPAVIAGVLRGVAADAGTDLGNED